MDDDQIYQRGGTEEDVKAYAREHGADLTKKDFIAILPPYFALRNGEVSYHKKTKSLGARCFYCGKGRLIKMIKSFREGVRELTEGWGWRYWLNKKHGYKMVAICPRCIKKHRQND